MIARIYYWRMWMKAQRALEPVLYPTSPNPGIEQVDC